MERVRNKIAVVTGAAAGIGRATAILLAGEGARVVLTDIDDEGGKAAVQAIRDAGGEARFERHDVALEDDWVRVMDAVEAGFGGLHILVNNAGYADFEDFETGANVEKWRRLLAVNLEGVMLGTRFAIPLMRRSGGGSIVNVSSAAGLVGMARLATYSAAKGGVRAFSKTMAVECGLKGDDIRVNSIYPGMIRTGAVERETANMMPGVAPRDTIDRIAKRIPLGRLGEAREVAQGILFLASDDSSYVTGAELAIDGGYTAQ